MDSTCVALTVSQLNGYIGAVFTNDDILSNVVVDGEISNFKLHTSGHLYFTLKDGDASVGAVMFRTAASRLKFQPQNGMKVRVYGRVNIYEKTGQCQVYAETMMLSGAGELAAAFEKLKRKLEAEGLFADERKKRLPRFPKKIGIVTSPTGAAVRDMLNVTGRRWGFADILIFPAHVQGVEAPPEICNGIAYLNTLDDIDVIIVGRGGGSAEDLWAFNDENVVRAVAASRIPIISAVGHETDFTLCDFVADKRAPTPSAAAEIVVPDSGKFLEWLAEEEKKLLLLSSGRINDMRAKLDNTEKMLSLRSPQNKLTNSALRLDGKTTELENAIERILKDCGQKLSQSAAKLDAISPLAVLSRGYGVMSDADGRVISSVRRVEAGDKVDIRLSDGSVTAEILGTISDKL